MSQDKKVDHKAEALRLLEEADELRMGKKPDPRGEKLLQAAALVHSNLAIAEGQERVAEELSRINRHFVHWERVWQEERSEPDSEEESR